MPSVQEIQSIIPVVHEVYSLIISDREAKQIPRAYPGYIDRFDRNLRSARRDLDHVAI